MEPLIEDTVERSGLLALQGGEEECRIVCAVMGLAVANGKDILGKKVSKAPVVFALDLHDGYWGELIEAALACADRAVCGFVGSSEVEPMDLFAVVNAACERDTGMFVCVEPWRWEKDRNEPPVEHYRFLARLSGCGVVFWSPELVRERAADMTVGTVSVSGKDRINILFENNSRRWETSLTL